MLITLNKQNQLKLTDLIQNNYTDLQLYREEPMLFDNGKYVLVVKPVPYREHDIFLKDMANLIYDHYTIFSQMEFLSAFNYRSDEALSEIIKKTGVFTADNKYSLFKKDSMKFVTKWGFISKKKDVLKPVHSKRKIKAFLDDVEPSEFIYIIYLTFVYNFDIVKKNTGEFLKMFKGDITVEESSPLIQDMSSTGISKRVVVMPKFSREPFSKSTLNLLEEQSQR